MTPLSWGVSEELVAEVTNKQHTDKQHTEITFDFSILCGQKKSNLK
ncbi:hypothetical protein [Paenibacillus segetis]|uniref:Uncharacterized protein n=1 Tax=Paenibacillus segetis TaxID=1325360 RepID=A0ABQ1Y2Z5_9BACL|nr:hypothetical protein [Paenibacillus segetis]GGH10884.1 hypothetical protein GCM10008013_02500 [Paenibacillus segetis]